MFLSRTVTDSPSHLIARALVRARFCEDVARTQGQANQAPEFFLVGLLSTIDSLLATPMEQVLETLPLQADVEAALATREGEMGRTLQLMEAYEQAHWSTVSAASRELSVPSDLLPAAYSLAVAEADQLAAAA